MKSNLREIHFNIKVQHPTVDENDGTIFYITCRNDNDLFDLHALLSWLLKSISYIAVVTYGKEHHIELEENDINRKYWRNIVAPFIFTRDRIDYFLVTENLKPTVNGIKCNAFYGEMAVASPEGS
jgi:hypothetical protein